MGSRDPGSAVGCAQQLNGARPFHGVLRCIVFCALFFVCGVKSQIHAQPEAPVEERPFFVIGVGAGAMSVDLPNPDNPGETFGTKFRSRFDMGIRPQQWLELAGELGLTQLGAADSVNAILEANSLPPDAAYTLVDWNVGARVPWPC